MNIICFNIQHWNVLVKTTVFYHIKKTLVRQNKKTNQTFYIREKDSIILFECKGIKLNGMLKDRADLSDVIEELKNKLFLSVNNVDKKIKKKKQKL